MSHKYHMVGEMIRALEEPLTRPGYYGPNFQETLTNIVADLKLLQQMVAEPSELDGPATPPVS